MASIQTLRARYERCARGRKAKGKPVWPVGKPSGATTCKHDFKKLYQASPDLARAIVKRELTTAFVNEQRLLEVQAQQAQTASQRDAALKRLAELRKRREEILVKAKKRKERLKKKVAQVATARDKSKALRARFKKARSKLAKQRADSGKVAHETVVADAVILDQAPLSEDEAIDLFIEEEMAEEYPGEFEEDLGVQDGGLPSWAPIAGAAAVGVLVLVIALR